MLQKEGNEQILKQTVSNGSVYEYVSEEKMLIFIQASVFSFEC